LGGNAWLRDLSRLYRRAQITGRATGARNICW
jgi:hypothetical protein